MSNEPSVTFAGLTDIGRDRDANEDHFFIADLTKSMVIHQSSIDFESKLEQSCMNRGQLYVVADGIGGDLAGERASELAIRTVSQYVLNVLPWFFRLDQEDDEDLHEQLKTAVMNCEDVIAAESAAVPALTGMGTTLTVGYVVWPTLYLVLVGDSRCYLKRGDQLQRVTRDHTLAQSLVDQGAMSAEDAHASPWVHVLHNAVGKGRDKLVPEVYRVDHGPGDALLFCTDGLTNEVDDDTIRAMLEGMSNPKEACKQLVDKANDSGGSDNITAIVAANGLELNS